MADKIKKIIDKSSITNDVDAWQSNRRHTEAEAKSMYKSPTIKLIDRINIVIDDINNNVLDSTQDASLQHRIAVNEQDIEQLKSGVRIENDGALSILPNGNLTLSDETKNSIANKVPKTLSILPQTSSESLSILNNRRNGKMFLDINGNATYVTVEQLKQLNTKIVSVDDLSDNRISGLSENDYVLLNKEI